MTILDAIQKHVETCPDKICFRFLGDGEQVTASLTYAALWEKVIAMASAEQIACCKNKVAILLLGPGLDFIITLLACMMAGVIPVPVNVPRPNRLENLRHIIQDAQAEVILTVNALHEIAIQLPVTEIIIINDVIPGHSDILPEICDNQVAFLQYTSGTTASSKGVTITHDNLLNNLENIHRKFNLTLADILVSWLPPYHDMGLVGCILGPLYTGVPIICMPPLYFIQQPFRWFRAITQFRATITGAPNFAFEYCVKRIAAEQQKDCDLSSVRLLFSGSERIRYDSIKKFQEKFACLGLNPKSIYPCYGMAETTLMATGGFLSESHCPVWHDQNNQEFVSCGTPIDAHQIVIADPAQQAILPEGEWGEIWIQGPSVSRGYWRQPGFADPFFRTGDRGMLWQGELFVSGRYKDIIIINGKNYCPYEIERVVAALSSHIAPAGVIAIGVEDQETERLVLLIEIMRTCIGITDWEELYSQIQAVLYDTFQLNCFDIRWVLERSLPRTSSGKLQRLQARAQYLNHLLKEVNNLSAKIP